MIDSSVDVFQELGGHVERCWRAENYCEVVFPTLAAGCLAEAAPQVSPQEVIDWALTTEALPRQFDLEADFGQPPLTVYHNDRFRIDVLFWLRDSVAIHEHNFQGAFASLYGTTLHSRFSFQQQAELAPDVFLGVLRHQHMERLAAGDVRQILPGAEMIHSVDHLTVPTLNLVIRTPHPLGPSRSQLSYLRSGIAFAPFHRPPGRVRKFQLLAALAKFGDQNELVEAICRYLAEADLGTRVLCLLRHSDVLLDQEISDRIFDRLELGEQVQQALIRQAKISKRESYLWRRRKRLRDQQLRFFLALLGNLPTRQAIFEQVELQHPGTSPTRQIVDWLRQISTIMASRYGSRTSSPKGLDTSLGEDGLWLLERVLEGATDNEILERISDAPAELKLDEGSARVILELIPRLWALHPLIECE